MWWPNDIKTGIANDSLDLIDEKTIAEPDIVDDREYTAHVFDGYFKAPEAGEYIFTIAADDRCALWFSDSDAQTLSTISARRDNWVNMRNLYNDGFDASTFKVTLAQGEVRYFMAIGMNFGGKGYFTVSAVIKNADTT